VIEPKRYLTDSLIPGDDICPDAVGEVYAMVVRYKDYARLKAEVERLTAFTTRTIIPNEILQAQVDRLTNAGDNLEQVLTEISYSYRAGNASHEWRAAKNYKPSV
jgi:hypothetical protein